jgi:hypothetical protein
MSDNPVRRLHPTLSMALDHKQTIDGLAGLRHEFRQVFQSNLPKVKSGSDPDPLKLEPAFYEYVRQYNEARPHRVLRLAQPILHLVMPSRDAAVRRDILNRLIHEYERAASQASGSAGLKSSSPVRPGAAPSIR